MIAAAEATTTNSMISIVPAKALVCSLISQSVDVLSNVLMRVFGKLFHSEVFSMSVPVKCFALIPSNHTRIRDEIEPVD